jgi:hypothetical protein
MRATSHVTCHSHIRIARFTGGRGETAGVPVETPAGGTRLRRPAVDLDNVKIPVDDPPIGRYRDVYIGKIELDQ